jgi:hypothetical protein
VGAT